MGPARLTLLAALAALATGCEEAPPPSALGTGEPSVVARVNDGDTLTLRDGAKVRLVQIDAPELFADCYGRAARDALARLAPAGARVRLVRDPRLDERDVHGRLLRYVFVGDVNVNVELVRRGAASPYYFRKRRGGYADALDEAVDDARDARRGLWRACPRAKLDTGLGAVTGAR